MALGVLGLCEATPRLVLGALGGVLVDRYDRRRLLILIQLVSALPVLGFLALYWPGVLQFWHILALEIFSGAARTINPPASQSILGDLVPRNEIVNAVSLYTIGFNVARVIGPSLGGILVIWIGVSGCYLVYGATLLLSALEFFFVRAPEKSPIKKEDNLLRELREGFSYIWHSPVILSSIIAAYTFAVFVITYQRFLPVFAKEVLNVGPRGLGILMAAPGLGGIIALIFIASVGEKWRKDALLWITTTLTPLFLILFCLSGSFPLSVGLLVLVGAGQISFRTISRVIIQIEAPRDLLGRVMSVFNMDQGMRSVGSMVMGASATIFGVALGLSLTAIVSLALTTALFYRLLIKGKES